jgi:hypothetical protein
MIEGESALDARAAARMVNLSVSGFWIAVRKERMPAPFYPLPRAPRWFPSELREAMLKTRELPSERLARSVRSRGQSHASRSTIAGTTAPLKTGKI